MKEILLVIALIGVAVVLLCVRVILRPGSKFGSEHIAENKRMQEDGIHCATSQDREARSRKSAKINVKNL